MNNFNQIPLLKFSEKYCRNRLSLFFKIFSAQPAGAVEYANCISADG